MIGDTIRAKRLEKGYSMDDLAAICGMTKTSIFKIENGKTRVLRPSTIRKIADALDMPYKVLAAENTGIPKEAVTGRIPVYPQHVCRSTVYNSEDIERYISFDTSDEMILLSHVVGIKVETNSMQPYAYKGDIVIVKLQPSVSGKEIAVIYIGNDDIRLRKLKYTQQGMQMALPDAAAYTERKTWQEVQELPVFTLGRLLEIRRIFSG